ncbi:ATP-dependent Clp protease proteolytic subunit [Actinoallomurus acanthiterrae]
MADTRGSEEAQMDFPTLEPRARVTELPKDVHSEQLFQRLLGQRIVFIGAEIDDDLANRVCSQLLLLAAEDGDRDIKVFINSPGGSMDAMFAMYDVMKYLPNDVSTVALGMAASAGQFLLTAGARGKRYALRNTRIMMHQPSGGIRGTASDIRIQAEQSVHMKHRFLQLIAEHTGRPYEQIEHDADRDRYFSAEEAREYGLIDHVVTSALEAGGVAP